MCVREGRGAREGVWGSGRVGATRGSYGCVGGEWEGQWPSLGHGQGPRDQCRAGRQANRGRGTLYCVCAQVSLTMECSGTRSGTKCKREAMEGAGAWRPRGQGTEPEPPWSEPGHQQQTSCPARNSFRERWCFPGPSSRPAGR